MTVAGVILIVVAVVFIGIHLWLAGDPIGPSLPAAYLGFAALGAGLVALACGAS